MENESRAGCEYGCATTASGLRVRVRLTGSTARWLAVLPGGRLGFTRDHNRDQQHFSLEPQPESNSYCLFSVSFGRPVVLEGTTLVLGDLNRDATLLDAIFDAHGRVLLSFGDSGKLQVNSAGECWVGVPTSDNGYFRHSCFELVEQSSEGRRGYLKLPTRLYLKTSRGCYLCASEAKLKEGPKVPCCCEELILDLPTTSPKLAGRGVTLASRMWTSDCQSVIMREIDGSLLAVRPNESYGRDTLSLRVCGGSGVLLRWEAPAHARSPHHHMPMRSVVHWGNLASLPHRHGRSQPAGRRLHGTHSNANAQENDASLSSKTGKAISETSVSPQPMAAKWSSFTSQATRRQGSFHRSLRSRSIQSGMHELDPATEALPTPKNSPIELCGFKSLLRATPEIVQCRDLLLVTHHGQFLTASDDAIRGLSHDQADPVVATAFPSAPLNATWELRFHGDNVYSLFCSAEKAAGQPTSRFLHVDTLGHVRAANSSAVWFPSPECLFEMKLVTRPGVGRRPSGVVGFTLRPLKAIQGAKRYLSAEPNGRITASRLKPGPWEVFSMVDVQAINSCTLPQPWMCLLTSDGASQADEHVARNIWQLAVMSRAAILSQEQHVCEEAGRLNMHQRAAALGWGVRSAATLGDICSRALVHALDHNNSSESLEEELRGCGLPEDIALRLHQQWSSRLCAPGAVCKKVLPREMMGAVFDQQRPERRLSLLDYCYECNRCSAHHLLMDPRVNSMHHWHLETIRRDVYVQHVQRPSVGPYLTLATVSIFIGTILGKLVAPAHEVVSLSYQQPCPQVMSGDARFGAPPQRSSRDGKSGFFGHLFRDPWLWTHVFVMNVVGRASSGR